MLDFLPSDLISHIISFTSPSDACCASTVSSTVRSSADSDTVWEKFLPSDYAEILPKFGFPLAYSTKKDLFLRLCATPQLFEGGRKIFSILHKSTGKKFYMLGARELSISWASNPLYWTWIPNHESRFSEVAVLRTTCWLQIQGKFNTSMLSPNTVYGAYLIVKFARSAYGLDTLPLETLFKVGDLKLEDKVYLRCREKFRQVSGDHFLNRTKTLRSKTHEVEERSLPEREDGWIEIELGSFHNDGDDHGKEVEMGLKEVTGEHLKGGLIVEGIELRPKQ